jgi:hypothetical protein
MLIVALGILTLLSLLALTFVSIMKLERHASTNYVDGVKSRMIAEGGLEAAAAQMKLLASGDPWSDPNAHWIYAQGNFWLPVEESSAIRKGATGDSATEAARRASFAASLGVSYTSGLDQYKVKVIDTQTQFNLNQAFEVHNEVDLNYVRWLDSLGVAISKLNPRARSGGTATAGAGGRNPIAAARYPRGNPNAWRGGEAIYRFRIAREGKRFNSKTELLEVLANEDDYNLVQDYVTTRSWFDPTTVTAVDQDAQDKKPWNDVQRKEQRSPINLNLATEECLAANLAGIAGRGIFLFTGEYDTRDSRTQNIDEGTPFQSTQYKELKQDGYGVVGVMVYIQPFGWTPGTNAGDPPDITGALELAKLLKARVKTAPFKSHAEWEDWVDTTVTDAFLERRDPSTGAFMFPGPDRGPGVPKILQLNDSPLTTPSEAVVKAHPAYKPWFYGAVRSMLKANFNPNPRLSSWNPDAAVHLTIDKGGLLFYLDPNQPASTKAQRQTLEWCMGSKGVFEITSLGEVLGPPPADQTKGPARIIYAQSKVQSVVKLYDTVTHTTQQDFERNGAKFRTDRGAMASHPVPRIYWDPTPYGGPNLQQWLDEGRGEYLYASRTDGHIQLSTKTQEGAGNDPEQANSSDTQMIDLGDRKFELLLQDRRVETPGGTAETQRDPLMADTSGGTRHHDPGTPATGRIGNGWGWPFGTARDGVSPSTRLREPRVEWRWDVLTPDGYLNTELRKTLLWYRANDLGSATLAATPEGRLRGQSQPNIQNGGNVAPAPKGGADFWYKPDFDWSIGGTGATASAIPDQRYCGLLAISHIMPNPNGRQGGASGNAPGSWTRGTQMYLTRTTSGDLRLTRLYFEVVGPEFDDQGRPNAQEEPYVEDPANPGRFIRFSDYYNNIKTDYKYTWPPKEFWVVPPPFDRIKWARTDHWLPFGTRLKDWRAHEWHHIAVQWDDWAGTVSMWLDGQAVQLVARAPTQLGPRYQPQAPNPAGTGPPVPGPQGVPPAPGELPAFVRLNARTGPSTPPSGMSQAAYEDSLRPKDQIVVGGVAREQAQAGGLFKHEKDALLPANGTIDELRLSTGDRNQVSNYRDRFETGEWLNEIDLSAAFADGVLEIGLASLSFTAYLPQKYAGAPLTNGGSVTVEFRVCEAGKPWADPKFGGTTAPLTAQFNNVRGGQPSISLVDARGLPLRVGKTDRLLYQVTMAPATVGGFGVATPVLDDVNLVYYLPNPTVLLKERVNN